MTLHQARMAAQKVFTAKLEGLDGRKYGVVASILHPGAEQLFDPARCKAAW